MTAGPVGQVTTLNNDKITQVNEVDQEPIHRRARPNITHMLYKMAWLGRDNPLEIDDLINSYCSCFLSSPSLPPSPAPARAVPPSFDQVIRAAGRSDGSEAIPSTTAASAAESPA